MPNPSSPDTADDNERKAKKRPEPPSISAPAATPTLRRSRPNKPSTTPPMPRRERPNMPPIWPTADYNRAANAEKIRAREAVYCVANREKLRAQRAARARRREASAARPMRATRREKVFGPGRTVPLDRNAKARVAAYARGWSARNRQPGQHKGPITRAFLDVLRALLWRFHNAHTGRCFPHMRPSPARRGAAEIPSMRRSRCWSSPAC